MQHYHTAITSVITVKVEYLLHYYSVTYIQ